jgi:L-fuconolactonase
MRIVDTHTHVVSKDRARYPLVTEGRTEATAWFLDHGVTVEGLLDRMDGAGVDAAVLVQAQSSYGTDHSYVVDSVPAGGGRLVGIGTVDVTGDDPGARARRAIDVEGLSGIRLFDPGTGELSSDGTLAVARELADLHVPLLVFTDGQRIPAVLDLIEAVPDLVVVLDHCAVPDLSSGPPWDGAGAVFALADHANIFLKVSSMTFDAAPAGTATEFVAALSARFGGERLLWGSDFSHTFDRPYAALVDLARHTTANLSPADQAEVLSGTAERLWPALAPAGP